MPPFPPIGIVGVTVLGAAGADGVPKLACVASQGGCPDMVTDIVAVSGLLKTLVKLRPINTLRAC